MSLMVRQILWIKTVDTNKKEVAKSILIKVTFEKEKERLRNIKTHDNIGCYFKIVGYFCINRNPFSLSVFKL